MRARRETVKAFNCEAEQTEPLHIWTHRNRATPGGSHPASKHAPAKMKERESRGRGGGQSATSRPSSDLPAPGVARPDSATRAGCEGLRSPSCKSPHLPHRGSRSHSGTPTPRLGLLGGNFAHEQGARPELRDPLPPQPGRERGSAAARGQVRGEPPGTERRGSGVPAGRGRGRGGGALTMGRTRE